MLIEFSNGNDKEGLYSLWQRVFGDSKEFLDKFFSVFYKEKNTVVCRDNGKVVSMLFLIPADITVKNVSFKAFYIYAAATDENYRKQGIMSKLLDFSREYSEKAGFDFLFLHPANDGLYNYYEKNGFCTAFYERNTEVTRNMLEKTNFGNYNYVRWNCDTVNFNSFMSDGEAFNCEHGYADIYRKNGEICVHNFCADNVQKLLLSVMDEYKTDSLLVSLPSMFGEFGGRRKKTGMLLPLNGNKLPDDDIYLGITLE